MTEGSSAEASEGALGLAWQSSWGCSPLLRFLGASGPEGVWRASRGTLLRWGLSLAAVRRFEERKRDFSLQGALCALEETGLWFVPYGSPCFPPGLTHLTYPPAGLFVRGSREALACLNDAPRVAVVGTRKASAYGARAAEVFTAALAGNGIAVISGMALGIDARAHIAALDCGGLSVAILGCGADVIYPRRHRHLYQRLGAEGLVLSELPPGCPPARWTFPHRNRLLAALADAVLVVEGSKVSGALQTAGWALELGRSVFAVPGPVFAENHEGCNALLYDGAPPAVDPQVLVEDFLSATGMERGERAPGPSAGSKAAGVSWAAAHEAGEGALLAALAVGACTVDDLVAQTGRPVRDITAGLARLQLQGVVVRGGPGQFLRAPDAREGESGGKCGTVAHKSSQNLPLPISREPRSRT